MNEQIVELNESEKEWIQKNLLVIQGIIKSVGKEEVLPENLDIAYSTWFQNHNAASEDPNLLINAFGIAFGQFLIDEFKLEWKMVSSDQSNELAVIGQPGDITIYPAKLVAKRYLKSETDFFSILFTGMQKEIQWIQNNQ